MKAISYLLASASAAMLLTGCLDDKYDLSDVDTTAQFKVENLTLPLNLDEITLGDIIDPKEDGNLKIIDGQYVFTDDGTFASDPVNIDPIHITAPYIAPLHDLIQSAGASGDETTYPVESSWASFNYLSEDVSEYILDITQIVPQMTMRIDISVDELRGSTGTMRFTDLRIKLPVGLEMTPSAGSYNPADGILTVPSATTNTGVLTLTASIERINVPTEAASFVPSTRTFTFSDKMRIESGNLTLRASEQPGMAAQMTLTVDFSFSDLTAEMMSGRVYYTMSGFDIAPINLDDLPDFLSQSGTDIKLFNPQIYMTVNNPVGEFDLTSYAGLKLTPIREEQPGTALSIDNGTFDIPATEGNGPYQFCLSPALPQKYPEGYTSPIHVDFTTLGNILSGDGLPKTINVDIPDAGIAPQDVTDLQLGDLGAVDGKYLFYSPLAFASNSLIRYADTVDGWNDDTVDKITIQHMVVTATATNTTPFDVTISGNPIGVGGQPINNVDILGADLPKGAVNQPITLYITGTVTHLDGITFTASLRNPADSEVLTPTEGINLKNVKVTVTGNYTDEL
ncbi:MAG: hypothetical protein NC187_00600 [Candidatus Amulumruptor caecigallinarius]|nr:hypothetical protein [Candidatus Amulumruptor caecigallinarius]MCM1395975.1 hypothetical protein [Candidatus Amulumruptor caecigallinarius]MCM1453007.1 hypothetical protein [bacterium]